MCSHFKTLSFTENMVNVSGLYTINTVIMDIGDGDCSTITCFSVQPCVLRIHN